MQIITRKKNQLMAGDAVFRFAGPNIYWLGLDENVGGINYPTSFRVENVLDTAKEMGANVIRSHTLGVSAGHPLSIQPELGHFNEAALQHVDYVLSELKKRELRVIIPLVDNWNYYHGGRQTYTDWLGLDKATAFYHSQAAIDAFKRHIQTLINRKNTVTGEWYRDDPTIMAWEVGNELNDAPKNWVEDICLFIKQLDNKHLVGFGKQFQLDQDKLTIESLDFIDVHYYPANAEAMKADAAAAATHGKVYIAGEFDWKPTEAKDFLKEAERNENVSGTCYWSLFGHADEAGYVQHFDSFSLHYPSVQTEALKAKQIQLLRQHAFTMAGQEPRNHEIPDAPSLHHRDGNISWQGVVGAACYTIEATDELEGEWFVICDSFVSDHQPCWQDSSRDYARDRWYRMRALNVNGMPGPYSAPLKSQAYALAVSL